ncbi:MAG: WbqC family protein [Rhodomicrobium sp.]
MRVVISQPMLFPWVGLLEQVRLAGVFVHYDDVHFSKGSFTNRVQIKTPQGPRWMTVPVKGLTLGQHIEDVEIQAMDQWVPRHIALLEQSFSGAPYADDAMALVRTVYSEVHRTIGTLARASLLAVSDYFGLSEGTRFIDVRDLDAGGSGSGRVLAIVKKLGGDEYVTGHGARNYLEHQAFEDAGVRVNYMNYECNPYPQLHGTFTPYVTSLDLVANCGKSGQAYIKSNAIPWREFLSGPA